MTVLEVTALPFGSRASGGGERFPEVFSNGVAARERVGRCFGSPDASMNDPGRFSFAVTAHAWPPFLAFDNPVPTIMSVGRIRDYLRKNSHEIEFVHVHNLRTAVSSVWLLEALLDRRRNYKVILTDHGSKFFPWPRLTVSPVDYYAPVSHYSDTILQAMKRRPSVIIPPAMTKSELDAITCRPSAGRDIDVLFIGRIVPWKAPDRIISISRHLIDQGISNLRVVIAGRAVDERYYTLLRQMVRVKNLTDCVRLIPNPSDDEIGTLFGRAKVHVHCSVSRDVYGRSYVHPELASRTVVEAAARGTPSVVSSLPSLEEQVVVGRTGYVIPEGDNSALESALVALLSSPTNLERFSSNAFRWVREERELSRIVDRFVEFLNERRSGGV